MKTLGVCVRIERGSYVAGFAVVEGDKLLKEDRLPAPSDEDQAGQLAELNRHTRDAIGHFKVDAVALKDSEIQAGGKNATLARRAEGAVLAAAGEPKDVAVTTWSGASMWKPAGFDERPKNTAIVSRLCGQLDQMPTTTETKQAAAAARVAILKA